MVDPMSTMPRGYENKTSSSKNDDLKKNFAFDLLNKYMDKEVIVHQDHPPKDGL